MNPYKKLAAEYSITKKDVRKLVNRSGYRPEGEKGNANR